MTCNHGTAYTEEEMHSVITLLPYADFRGSTEVLEDQRLGRCVMDVASMLAALAGDTEGWSKAPGTLMWLGYEGQLIWYGLTACMEMRRRGWKAGLMAIRIAERQTHFGSRGPMPPWRGDPELHQSHRSLLLRENPEHYRPLWPNDPDDLPLLWPV